MAAEKAKATVESPAGRTFERAKPVTIPVLKMEIDKPVFVRITGPIHEGKRLEKVKEGETPKKPARVCDGVNLETGELVVIICGTILESELHNAYPNDGYVGKSFEIRKLDKKANKSYNGYEVFELKG